jgi:hypothetical protein
MSVASGEPTTESSAMTSKILGFPRNGTTMGNRRD